MDQTLEQPHVLSTKWTLWLLFGFFSSGLLVFAIFVGGFTSDLGGDPDEAAHAVTSLMLRDYMTSGIGHDPMTFALSYYADFPKVALGHYPPVYYCVAAPLLLISPSIHTLIALQVLLLAALATLTFLVGRRLFPLPLAIVAGIGVAVLPVALKLTLNVMADTLLAVLCLWAAVLWADYLRSPTLKRSMCWGCVAAAAILTKGSGVGLCLLPPLATLLTGKFRLFFRPSWWCAALPVLILAGPWMLYSTKISQEGMTRLRPYQYLMEAVPFHLKAMPEVFGWPITLLFVLAISMGCIGCWKHRMLGSETASLTAMTVGMTAVLLLVPVGLTTRYMLTLVPPVLLASASVFASLATSKRNDHVIMTSSALLLVFSFLPLYLSDILPRKDVNGFKEAVQHAGVPKKSATKQQWLIASDPRGEGAVIAAAAFLCPKRFPSLLKIYRGSKELAKSDWMGRGYQLQYTSPSSLLNRLDELKITRVFVDRSVPEAERKEHEKQLFDTLNASKAKWQLQEEQNVSRTFFQKGKLLIYKRL